MIVLFQVSQSKDEVIEFLLRHIIDCSSDDDFTEICNRLEQKGCYLCSFIMSNGPG